MSNSTLSRPQAAPRRERGLGYAVLGGLGITLIAVLLGAVYWLWFYTSQRPASPAELLPADTQLYIALAPSLGDMPEGAQVARVLRDQLGITDPQRVRDGAVRVLGVDYEDNLLTWVGGTMAVAVRGQGDTSSEALLRDGEVVFILGSRNDPQAEAFITRHLAARAARGDTIAPTTVGETTVYTQQGGAPSPIAAFTLFEHYIIFANRPEPITAMIGRLAGRGDSLAGVPAFAQFAEGQTERVPGGRYSAAGAPPEAELAALRELLLNLDR
jgi:hypothetical protein